MKDDNPLYVSKRSKRGILIFVAIALVIVFTPRIIHSISEKDQFIITEIELEEFRENYAQQEIKKERKSYKKKLRYHKPPSKFDPNSYTEKNWRDLGLSEKQVSVVMKFTARGIYSNEQLEKIFVIPKELFLLIKDSTYYTEKVKYKEREYNKDLTKEIILVELNGADQEKLESIPGIGSFYAKNILKYRSQLGGFYKKEQLLEVWKMDVEKYTSIEKFVALNMEKIRLIPLNSITVEELKNHPYIGWSVANSIIKMRSQKGSFNSIHEIKESVLIDKELFEKLKPYLSL